MIFSPTFRLQTFFPHILKKSSIWCCALSTSLPPPLLQRSEKTLSKYHHPRSQRQDSSDQFISLASPTGLSRLIGPCPRFLSSFPSSFFSPRSREEASHRPPSLYCPSRSSMAHRCPLDRTQSERPSGRPSLSADASSGGRYGSGKFVCAQRRKKRRWLAKVSKASSLYFHHKQD